MYAVIYGIRSVFGGKYEFEAVRFFASREDALTFAKECTAAPSPYPPADAGQEGETGWYVRLFEILDGCDYGDGWICDMQGNPVDPFYSACELYQKG
jgi:hypothetical protein